MKIDLKFGEAVAIINEFLMQHAAKATENKPYCCSTEKLVDLADKFVSKHVVELEIYDEYMEDFAAIPEPFNSWEDTKEYD